VLGLALVPGLPALPFLVIGSLLFVASRARARQIQVEAELAENEPIQRRPGEASGPRFVPVVVPWSLEVSSDLAELVDDDVRGEQLRRAGIRAAGAAAREVLFRELGVPLPPCRVTVSASLPERHVVLAIHEVPAAVLALPGDLPDERVAEHVVARALDVLRERAADFLGIAETQVLLDELEQVAPATVRQVVPKPVPLTLLADVLRRLVEEGVSIRDLKAVLEALAQVANVDKDPLNLAEFVRSQLRRPITHQLTAGSRELGVVLLEPHIEETVRGSIQRTPAGSFLTLAPAAGRDVVHAVRRAFEDTDARALRAAVVLTQPDIRRFVRKLLETDLPDVRVVSYAELLPEVSIRPLGKASIAMAQRS
jgi:type III secretion protein V